LKIIDTCHNGDFRGIWSVNPDGSLSIDVFDLYKGKDEHFLVKEDGFIVKETILVWCLDYIHSWI